MSLRWVLNKFSKNGLSSVLIVDSSLNFSENAVREIAGKDCVVEYMDALSLSEMNKYPRNYFDLVYIPFDNFVLEKDFSLLCELFMKTKIEGCFYSDTKLIFNIIHEHKEYLGSDDAAFWIRRHHYGMLVNRMDRLPTKDQSVCNVSDYHGFSLDYCENRELDIAVLNNGPAECVEEQLRLMKKYIEDDYHYTLFDVSKDPDNASKVKELCIKNNISYVRLNFFRGNDTYYELHNKIAAKLHYILHDYLIQRRSLFIGLLHQDLFPVKPHSILKKNRRKPFFGRPIPFTYNGVTYGSEEEEIRRIQLTNTSHYLWEGYCFFRRDLYLNNVVDFSAHFLRHGNKSFFWHDYGIQEFECGGFNFFNFIRGHCMESWGCLMRGYKKQFVEDDTIYEFHGDAIMRNHLEYFDDFVHTIGGGLWDTKNLDAVNAKIKKLIEYLKKF